jgi:hypothetical protein
MPTDSCMATKTVSVHLSPDLLHRIDAQATNEHRTRSQMFQVLAMRALGTSPRVLTMPLIVDEDGDPAVVSYHDALA